MVLLAAAGGRRVGAVTSGRQWEHWLLIGLLDTWTPDTRHRTLDTGQILILTVPGYFLFLKGGAPRGGLLNQRSGGDFGNDYQEEPVASEIGTADNVSSDGCEILLMHLSLLLSTQETTMHAD